MGRLTTPQFWVDNRAGAGREFYLRLHLRKVGTNLMYNADAHSYPSPDPAGYDVRCGSFWILTTFGSHPSDVYEYDSFEIVNYSLLTPNVPVYVANPDVILTIDTTCPGYGGNPRILTTTSNPVIIRYGTPEPPPTVTLDMTPNTLNLTRGQSTRTRLRVANIGTEPSTRNVSITSESGLNLRAIPR